MAGVTQPIISGGKPDPDPTILTTENLRREIANLKEQINSRLDLNDKAIAIDRVSNDAAIGNLHELILANIETLEKVTAQRFDGIAIQFTERDKRTEQLSLADKTAIAAALQAQKEAAGAQNESNAASVLKQEAAFTKLLDQTQALFQTSMSALTTQINDLKSRLDTGEGRGMATSESKQDRSTDKGQSLVMVSIAIALAAFVFAVVMALRGQ